MILIKEPGEEAKSPNSATFSVVGMKGKLKCGIRKEDANFAW